MSLTMEAIKDIQKNFDLTHGVDGRGFYVPVGEENVSHLEHMAVCLVGEMGEFCNILKKVVRGDMDLLQAKRQMSEELADVFIYLIKISNQFDVDIESEFLKKLKKNESRFEKILE